MLLLARSQAGLSQMELALRLGVSQRHVGFVERDRARPSRTLLTRWLDALGLDASQRNAALLLAGYAPAIAVPGQGGLDPSDVALRTVGLHAPNPALAFDANWQIVHVNAAARWLCGLVMPELPLGAAGFDMLSVLAHPAGWLAQSREPVAVASALLTQLRAEQWLNPGLERRIEALETALRRRYGTDAASPSREASETSFNVTFETALGLLSFTAVQTHFGLRQDVAGRRLRAELWFPADEHTSTLLRLHAPRLAAA